MPPLLSCQSLAKIFSGRTLFESISLSIQDDERMGLIGPNGSGKSTLLKILAGLETADAGERVVSQTLRLSYLPQADVFAAGATAVQAVMQGFAGTSLDVHEQETRSRVLLAKIGFADTDQPVATLSGGWKKRLAIARAVITEPNLLLLDEPTNHLDVEGILWLEEYLRASNMAFVVVTHDRYFLENVTRRVVELDRKYPQGFFSVPGSYSTFLERREEFLIGQQAYQESLDNKVRGEIEWLRRKAKARTTKAKARIDEAGRMIEELGEMKSRLGKSTAAQIDFTGTQRKTKELIVAEGIAKGYAGRTLIRDLSLTLSPGVRLGLLGENGSGKTTLLRLLAGLEPPDDGNIRRAKDLNVVVFDQSRERLNKDAPLRQALAVQGGDAVVYRGQSVHIASWARRFLFRNDQLDRPVGALSGGEQARVLIARLMLEPADVLFLDEPTNDLDIPTLEVLEDSLSDFPGALVLVTHDRFMLDRVSTTLLAFDGTGNTTFFADFAQWQAAEAERKKVTKETAPEKEKAKPAATPAAKPKKLSYKEQREWDGMEQAILEAEERLADWKRQLEDPANASNGVKLLECSKEVEAAQAAVDALYARWAELERKVRE